MTVGRNGPRSGKWLENGNLARDVSDVPVKRGLRAAHEECMQPDVCGFCRAEEMYAPVGLSHGTKNCYESGCGCQPCRIASRRADVRLRAQRLRENVARSQKVSSGCA